MAQAGSIQIESVARRGWVLTLSRHHESQRALFIRLADLGIGGFGVLGLRQEAGFPGAIHRRRADDGRCLFHWLGPGDVADVHRYRCGDHRNLRLHIRVKRTGVNLVELLFLDIDNFPPRRGGDYHRLYQG